jgi:hypothetical protein
VGVKPFGVFSYKARVSPHAKVGYEINGDSKLAGDNLALEPVATEALMNASLTAHVLARH